VTLLKIALKEDVKMVTDLQLILPVKCVLNFTVKNVMKIKKFVLLASMDGDYGILLPQEMKPPKTLNVNNVKLDVLNVTQTEKFVLSAILQAFWILKT
jgi:hypothetical protein